MSDKPAKKFRIGFVTATIWKNESADRAFYSVELSRSYKDDKGEYQNGTSLNHNDLLNAAKVLERCEHWVASQ